MKPFRVVRTYFRMPPEPGGMEQHIARLSQHQRAMGVAVVNVFNVGEGGDDAMRLWRGIDLLHIRPASLRSIVFYGAAIAMADRLRSPMPTILHVHGAWSDFLLAPWLGRRLGAKAMFASIHDAIPESQLQLYGKALSPFAAVLTTGKSDQDRLSALLPVPVVHRPSGLGPAFADAALWQAPVRYDVACVAHLAPKKRVDLVVECAALRPDLRFVIAGDGECRAALEGDIRRRTLTNVTFTGRLEPAGVVDLLRTSRVLLSTSEREGTPTSVLEAMAMGLPIIITPSNDYCWLMENGVTGYITEGWSPAELVAHLDSVLHDESRRLQMGALAAARVQGHAWPKIAATVTAMMEKALEESKV